ncbi:GT-D fold domain-containing glycosyltransferase [Tatumella sp. UBA2305]|uniref:GT-D fold domain-containing glycosyltransferase n=1 Tax=Tatumella sp. UBA2305 TaxID=1947647 RepID=UPI0025FC6751|nr:GT-D fold domain-containing glycosyltransferase [Tatumella sp. UBA2305]
MTSLNNIYKKIRFPFKFSLALIMYFFSYHKVKNIKVLSINETFDILIKNPHLSVARYGDGELEMLNYKNIGFQSFNADLSTRLINILKEVNDNKNCLVCMPDGFFNTKSFKRGPALFWFFHKAFFFHKYNHLLSKEYIYGNTSLTRPYNDYKDKGSSVIAFQKFKDLLAGSRVLIVEGAGTKLGVGNDLLNIASNVIRITTVNRNAFNFYGEIYQEVIDNKDLFDVALISLGPTATVLSFELSKAGIRCIDTGHIDIEYEWMLSNAQSKIAIVGKNVNEAGIVSSDNGQLVDTIYSSQIISHIG